MDLLINLAKIYNKSPDKYLDIVKLEKNPKMKQALIMGVILATMCPINPKTGLVEKSKPKMSDWGKYCQLQNTMEQHDWLTLFGI